MSQLTPIQNQVLAGLLAGKSVSAVARENGIHRSTIYHWRHEHAYFGMALDQARSRHQVNLYDFVQDLTEQAMETVATMLESDDPALRLRAAQAILRIAEPGRLPKGIRSDLELETFADQTLIQKAALDLREMLGPTPEAAESDTIRQNPTVKPSAQRGARTLSSETIAACCVVRDVTGEPPRNSRCSCGSGLKYKRCCGSVVAPSVPNPVSLPAFVSRPGSFSTETESV